MKKILVMSVLLVGVFIYATFGFSQTCVTIQEGTLVDSVGGLISTGYDEWGYNYQAHTFNGAYDDADRVSGGIYPDVELLMKWNDAWLSNRSCDGDNKLDRYFGYTSYVGSGAWLTNHQSGRVDGGKRKWTYFVKIVAVETTDVLVGGYYYRDGVELGPAIWGAFAIVEQVSNDPSYGEHGILYKSPVGPGLGNLN